jgi:hypothetical protein
MTKRKYKPISKLTVAKFMFGFYDILFKENKFVAWYCKAKLATKLVGLEIKNWFKKHFKK